MESTTAARLVERMLGIIERAERRESGLPGPPRGAVHGSQASVVSFLDGTVEVDIERKASLGRDEVYAEYQSWCQQRPDQKLVNELGFRVYLRRWVRRRLALKGCTPMQVDAFGGRDLEGAGGVWVGLKFLPSSLPREVDSQNAWCEACGSVGLNIKPQGDQVAGAASPLKTPEGAVYSFLNSSVKITGSVLDRVYKAELWTRFKGFCSKHEYITPISRFFFGKIVRAWVKRELSKLGKDDIFIVDFMRKEFEGRDSKKVIGKKRGEYYRSIVAV